MHSNVRVKIVSSAACLFLAACSSQPSITSAGPVPFADTQPAVSLVRDRISNVTGSIHAPVGFPGVDPAVRQSRRGWMSAVAKGTGPKLYVSDDGANVLYIYDARHPTTPIGTITSGISSPVGTFVDRRGNLYVANLGGNAVTVYPKGSTAPSKTYTSGVSEPTSVAVGSDGTLYVSEFPTNAIVEFGPHKTTPTRTLSVKSVQGVALDSKNNLYATYTNPNTGMGGVEKFKPKATVGTDLGITLGDPGDVKLDSKNDLLVGDQRSDTIGFYKPGATTPYGTISTPQTPFKFALDKTEKLLYVATGINVLYIFDAVPNGQLVTTLSSGLQSTSGVSLNPPPPL